MDLTEYSETTSALIRFNGMLGIAKRLRGVHYGHVVEYTRVYDSLSLTEDSRLLDIGTGQHAVLPWFCAYQTGCRVHATDIGEYIFKQRAVVQGLPRLREMLEAGRIVIEQQDAVNLSYEDESFDAVTAISSIEHIPDDGDTKAVREVHRVLKPGGIFALTVPVNRGAPYQADYRERKAYVTEYVDEPVFFSHCYDDGALRTRLVEAAPFTEAEVEYWSDGDWYPEVWHKRAPARNVLKRIFGWWLQRKALQNFTRVEQYEGSDAWLAIVILRK